MQIIRPRKYNNKVLIWKICRRIQESNTSNKTIYELFFFFVIFQILAYINSYRKNLKSEHIVQLYFGQKIKENKIKNKGKNRFFYYNK